MEKITLLCLFTLSFAFVIEEISATKEEAQALLKWKNCLNYSPSRLSSSWSLTNTTSNIPCNWIGIRCDKFETVVEISLDNLSLNGTLDQFDFLAFPNLTNLSFHSNRLFGRIPNQIGSLSKLISLDLAKNNFTGMISPKIGNLLELQHLSLLKNSLTGVIPLQLFTGLRNLQSLYLSHNSLEGAIPTEIKNLTKLEKLWLGFNKLNGNIPHEIGLLSNLTMLYLPSNPFTSGPMPSFLGKLRMLQHLDLSNTSLINSTIPNELGFCTSLTYLDLSSNNLSGPIPNELGDCKELSFLKLSDNRLIREIPESICKLSYLEIFDASHNQLEGRVPRCLVNSNLLQVLDLGNNKLHDTFPFWLEILPSLQVLVLRSNIFHGSIMHFRTNCGFQNLHVIDISSNEFTGPLPSKCFQNWRAMTTVDETRLEYIDQNKPYYHISITLSYKGQNRTLEKILTTFASLDFSNNRFQSEIPKVIGDLKSLILLNLSCNDLIGHIPSSLGKLLQLESLDLSQNNLSGEIPQQLLLLTFLAMMNLAQNRLEGSIPRGRQFDTFSSTSYEGNPGLCGPPLSKQCKGVDAILPPMTLQQPKDSTPTSAFDWEFMWMGYGCGVVIGFAIGYTIFWGENECLTRTFGGEPHSRIKRFFCLNEHC